MWIGARIIIGGTADISRVQNQRAGWQLDQVLLVTVTTEDNTGANVSQSLLDDGQWCPDKPVLRNLLDEILIVIRWRQARMSCPASAAVGNAFEPMSVTHPIVRLWGGFSVLPHPCASTGFGGGTTRTFDRERQTRRRVELLVSPHASMTSLAARFAQPSPGPLDRTG
jgi:hypothetical protein